MQIGSPLQALDGYRTLERGITYFFLKSCRLRQRVLLVTFSATSPVLGSLVILDRSVFEDGVLGGFVTTGEAIGLPYHLAHYRDVDFNSLDIDRLGAKITHQERVLKRFDQILPLLDREQEILSADSPEKEINKYAVGAGLNGQRTRTWFFLYVCFRSVWVLIPDFSAVGKWDRDVHLQGRKFGRPSTLRGGEAGARLSKNVQEKIVSSYLRAARPGRTLTSIYRETMLQSFGAKVLTDDRGMKRLVAGGADPVPTYDQFRYRLGIDLGLNRIRERRYGSNRTRRQYSEYLGTFASEVSNLCEVAEADGYYVEDRPRGLVDGQALPRLCVVRSVDIASGMRLGIGFSLGKEDAQAYHAMLFCTAIPKRRFCNLFGIDIEESEWPSAGLPTRMVTDRGPGVKREPGHEIDQEPEGLVIRELTVSGAGQSKATVESSQRKITRTEDARSMVVSNLSAFELAQREIRALLAENASASSRQRLTPQMLQADVPPNPIGVWNYLDGRGRSNAQAIAFDTAVRRFLIRTEVRIDRHGAHLYHQRYDSAALRCTGILKSISTIGTQRVAAYVFPFSIRVLWIEIDKRLIEVEAQLALRDDPDQLGRGLRDLELEHSVVKRNDIEARENRSAAHVEQMDKFQDRPGKKWNSEKRAPLRTASRSAKLAAAKDLAETQALVHGGHYE